MNDLNQKVVEALADAVRRNEGLREAIEARGLPLKETMRELQKHYRELFREAHAEKQELVHRSAGLSVENNEAEPYEDVAAHQWLS